jgi:hypothetical protein
MAEKARCKGKPRGRKGRSKMKSWDKAETKRFRDEYPKNSNRELARMFGRSKQSIQGRAQALGLHKSKKHLKGLGRKV